MMLAYVEHSDIKGILLLKICFAFVRNFSGVPNCKSLNEEKNYVLHPPPPPLSERCFPSFTTSQNNIFMKKFKFPQKQDCFVSSESFDSKFDFTCLIPFIHFNWISFDWILCGWGIFVSIVERMLPQNIFNCSVSSIG